MPETLLVTGIHREELGFGDRVASLLDEGLIQVMRIPEGISHTQNGKDDQFYYDTYCGVWQSIRDSTPLVREAAAGENSSGLGGKLFRWRQ